MVRRAQKNISGVHLAVGCGLVILLAGVGYFIIQPTVTSPYRTLPELNVSSYLENANSLRGNTYQMKGMIQHSLAWSSGFGRLFSIRVDSGNGEQLVPVLIPAALNDINVQRGQEFLFKLEVVEAGLLLVSEMQKS